MANPNAVLDVLKAFIVLNILFPEIAVVVDIVLLAILGIQAGSSLWNFLFNVYKAEDINDLDKAADDFAAFVEAISGLALADSMVLVSKVLKRWIAAKNANRLSFPTTLSKGERAILLQREALEALREDIRLVFGEATDDVIKHVNGTAENAAAFTQRFTSLFEILQKLRDPQYATIQNALKSYPGSITSILEFGVPAIEVLAQRSAQFLDDPAVWARRLSFMSSPQEGAELLEAVQFALKKRQELGLNIVNSQGDLTNTFAYGEYRLTNPTLSGTRENTISISGRSTSETLPAAEPQ